MKVTLKILFWLLTSFGVMPANAQREKPPRIIQNNYRYTSIGLGGGSSHYFGELAPYKYPIQAASTMVRWNGTIDYTRHTSPWLATRLAFSWVRIAGSDYAFGKKNLTNFDFANNYIRNLHFRNDVKELSLVSMLNIVEQDKRGYLKRDRFNPYLFIGISLIQHNPKAVSWKVPTGVVYDYTAIQPEDRKVAANWISLRNDLTSKIGTEGQGVTIPTLVDDTYPKKYSNIQVAIPLGIGTRIRINENWDFSMEAGLSITTTKYLDDVGNKYANPLDLPAPSNTPYTLSPLPANTDFYPLSNERLLANPSRVLKDGYFGADRATDLNNIDVTFAAMVPRLSQERAYDKNPQRGSSNPIPDSFLTFKVKMNYIIGKKVKCPPIK